MRRNVFNPNVLSIAWLAFTILAATLKMLHIGGAFFALVYMSVSFLLGLILMFLALRKQWEFKHSLTLLPARRTQL
ncbi:hypothetical protein ACVWYG_002475 [Pedobacter sp. UYEF25]